MFDILFDLMEAQYVAFLLVGIVLIALGGFLVADELYFRRAAKSCRGKVVGLLCKTKQRTKKSGAPYEKKYYYPHVAFHPPESADPVFTKGDTGSNPPAYKIGQMVTVLYHPTALEKARIAGKSKWIFGGICLVMGVVFSWLYLANYTFDWAAGLLLLGLLGFGLKKFNGFAYKHGITMQNWREKLEERKAHKKQDDDDHMELITDPEQLAAFQKSNTKTSGGGANAKEMPYWGMVLFCLFGLGAIGVSVHLVNKQIEFKNHAVETSGVVTGLESKCDSDGCTYCPKVRFTTQGGQTVNFKHSTCSKPAGYESGEQVVVQYKPDHPEDAQIKGWLNWLMPFICAAFGVVFVWVSAYMFKAKRRSAKELDT